ncbi:hypothetical protein TNCT_419991 [Trichonephila clavata]|uniref:Uncharacterized protein n=1 Tax=Trichonephila clavata TaxID=2740835 RepID=A0A8X6I674_TRICU|nr:hypothetical protein TNCT_419991 [Trichonephila clavata]
MRTAINRMRLVIDADRGKDWVRRAFIIPMKTNTAFIKLLGRDGTEPEFCQLTIQNGLEEIETEESINGKKLIGLPEKKESLPLLK